MLDSTFLTDFVRFKRGGSPNYITTRHNTTCRRLYRACGTGVLTGDIVLAVYVSQIND